MRKADYATLAALIKKRSDDARGMAALQPAQAVALNAQADALENLALSFVRFASVNRAKFLKACGIEP